VCADVRGRVAEIQTLEWSGIAVLPIGVIHPCAALRGLPHLAPVASNMQMNVSLREAQVEGPQSVSTRSDCQQLASRRRTTVVTFSATSSRVAASLLSWEATDNSGS
jgi:hypothetical protein